MIIHFSGTGNSSFIADFLARELNDVSVDSTEFIKCGKTPEFDSNEPYVFVAPTYAWQLPKVFVEWLGKCTFYGNKKAYFVLTCGGEIGAASLYAEQLSHKLGFQYMEMAEVVMPENYIAMFSSPTVEEEKEIIAKAKEQLPDLVARIKAKIPFERVVITPGGRVMSGLINKLFYKFSVSAKKFYVKEDCVACGACVGNCMLNNIKMVDGKPKWGKNCTHCMACINKCPVEAIEYGNHTKGLRRYVFPKENK